MWINICDELARKLADNAVGGLGLRREEKGSAFGGGIKLFIQSGGMETLKGLWFME